MINSQAICAALLVNLTMAWVAPGQSPAPAPAGRGGAPGRAAAPPQTRAEWRVRNVAEVGSFLKWKVGAPADAFHGLSFLEAAVRLDVLGLAYVEGSNQ